MVTEKESKDGTITQAVDFDLLRQKLADVVVDGGDERYRLDWPGKKASLLKANTPIAKTLRPDHKSSVDFEHTQNVFIEGDNFEALKVLQESYLGKVKMIYIDPPYNTGKDFVYSDNFTVAKADYEEEIEAVDEEGNKMFRENTKTNPRFHSDWLSMMYERLLIARDLLTDDGVIFISIDDNEVHNLRKICDEVFGEENFRGSIVRATGTTTGQDGLKIGSSYDSCLTYSKSSLFEFKGVQLKGKDLNRFCNDDDNGRGKYALLQLRKTGNADRKEDRENMFYPINAPDNSLVYPVGPSGYLSRWRTSKNKFKELLNNDLIVWKENSDLDDLDEDLVKEECEEKDYSIVNNENVDIEKFKSKWKPYVKYYLNDRTKQVSNLWIDIDGNKKGSIELKQLFENKKIFDNPKPTDFIKQVIRISCDSNSIILDFFAGSAASANAILELTAEENSNQKFIMIQLDEETPEGSEARKAGYATIAEIARERIRRAGAKIRADFADKLAERESPLDTGFRAYKASDTSFVDVERHPSELEQGQLFDLARNLKEDRTPADLLTEVMLSLGLTLDLTIEEKNIGENTVFYVASNALVACFDQNISLSLIDEIAKSEPVQVVFRDGSFGSDEDLINAETHLKRLSPDTILSVL